MNRKVKLGEIASFQTGPFGTQLKASEYSKKGTPIINVKNIGYGNLILDNLDYVPDTVCSRLNNHLLKEGDIVFGRKGSVDRHCYIKVENENWMQGSDCIRVRLSNKVNSRYISYYLMLNQVKKQINFASIGSTMASINTNILKKVEIVLPCVEKQKLIVNVLSKIDEKIENNNAINNELEMMAKTIYDYWFLQFDFPDENGKPYKSSGGKMVWNDKVKNEIPEGWKVTKLEDLCSFSNGINYDKNITGDKNYKIVNVRNITDSSLLLDSGTFDVIHLLSSQAEKYLVEPSDILIARSGTPGAIRIIFSYEENIIYCGFIIRCSLNEKKQRLFLTYALKKLEGSNATKTGGSIMQNVSQETLKQIEVCLPSEDVIDRYNNIIIPIISKMQACIKENQELTSLRDFLLPLLMNGQIGFR